MRLILALGLLCSAPALAAITLDTTLCSGGTVTNCPHAHITGSVAYTSGTSASVNTTAIAVAGSGTILYAVILDENHGSGSSTGAPVIAAQTSGNYSTQWTLVTGSNAVPASLTSTSGGASIYRAVSASAFSGETPKLTLSCVGGTALCAGTNIAAIEVHVQFYGYTSSFPTPGNVATNTLVSATPSLSLVTSSGDKLFMSWFDNSSLSCTQTLTSGAAIVDAWEPGQVSPIVGCNGGADDYFLAEDTSGTTSAGTTVIGVTSPTNATGVMIAFGICDSTASACPNIAAAPSNLMMMGVGASLDRHEEERPPPLIVRAVERGAQPYLHAIGRGFEILSVGQ